MRISVSWLRDLLASTTPASDPNVRSMSTKEIATRLTALGLEVEGVERFGEGIEPVVVAEVRAIRPHPSASTLRLVTVDRGGQEQEVVCGAPNVPEPGGLVAFAPLGTHLPAVNMTLASREIRGVKSEGMLCSERELGVGFGTKKGTSSAPSGDDHDHGIMILPAGVAKPGTPLHVAIPSIVDDILEVGVTPNRPDALGHVGVARDLAAALGVAYADDARLDAFATLSSRDVLDVEATSLAHVTIDPAAADRCPEYAAAVIEGVRVGPSSLFARYRLHALGMRSVSNVVDVTNLVMLERGHPLHAFDLDRLENKSIHVRLARAGESIRTLDGIVRPLVADDLVICDGAPNGGVPVALAGVMGGGDSEINPATTRVLLEVAYFDPRSVRRSSRRHGLHTEASHRFERGVDSSGVRRTLRRATGELLDAAGGKTAKGIVDVVGKTLAPLTVTLRHARIGALLGLEVAADRVTKILHDLAFSPSDWRDGACTVTVPAHRPDVTREVDLIEEVARVVGLDAIPSVVPAIAPQPARTSGSLERRARQLCKDLGLAESITFAFTSPAELATLHAPEAAVHVQNPLGEERGVLRTTLLTGLLAGLRRSRRHGERRARAFEVGMRFLKSEDVLPDEALSLAVVLAGPRDVWLGAGEEVDVTDAKGIAVELVERLSGRRAEVRALRDDARPKHLHPRGAAEIVLDSRARVGTFGPLHPDVVDALALDGGALVIEIDLRAIDAFAFVLPKFRTLTTMQAAVRDLALEVDEATTAGDLQGALSTAAGELCARVEVFDVYRGKGVPTGRKSIALRLTYRDPKDARTLTDAEIDAAQTRAIEASRALGAVLRGA